jgi:hypothetical protein
MPLPPAASDADLKAAFARLDAAFTAVMGPTRPQTCAGVHGPFSDPLFDLSPTLALRHVRRRLHDKDGF